MAAAEGQRIGREIDRRLAAAAGLLQGKASGVETQRGWDPVRIKAQSEIAELEAQGEGVPPEIRAAA